MLGVRYDLVASDDLCDAIDGAAVVDNLSEPVCDEPERVDVVAVDEFEAVLYGLDDGLDVVLEARVDGAELGQVVGLVVAPVGVVVKCQAKVKCDNVTVGVYGVFDVFHQLVDVCDDAGAGSFFLVFSVEMHRGVHDGSMHWWCGGCALIDSTAVL